jgi:glucose-1-phosphatase
MILEGIKNIIFDLGDVIINIAPELTAKALEKFLSESQTLDWQAIAQSDIFLKHEKGEISDSTFFEQLKAKFQLQATENDIKTAWNVLLLDIPMARVKLIEKLGEKYRLFLLSNTNFCHIQATNHILEQTTGIKHLSELFEKLYLSYEMKTRKPEANIYEQVLRKSNLIATETLFIDDNAANIEAAKKLNIKTLHIFPKENSFVDFL